MIQNILVEIGGDASGLEQATGRARDALGRFVSTGERAGQQFASVFGERISRQLGVIATGMEKAGKAISTYVSAPLGLLAAQSVRTYGDMDALRRGLATLEKDAGSLTTRMGELNEVAKLPGLGMKLFYHLCRAYV